MVGEEGEEGQRVAKAFCMSMSFCSPLPTVTSFPSNLWSPFPEAGKALQISVHLPTVRAFCFGSARAEFKLCLELTDTALGAKVYSWRRD